MIKIVLTAAAALVLGSLSGSNVYAAGSPIAESEVKNAMGCLPSLADPPDAMVQFKDGKFTSSDYPFANIRATAFGVLDGAPAAVGEICWNTGGSGNWEVIELFRKKKDGKVVGDKVYWPHDLPKGGTMVGRIEIKNNKIYLYGEAPMEHRKIATPLIISTKDFTQHRE